MISPSVIEKARDKLFVNTYCIGEPPDAEIALSYFFDALRSMIDRQRQARCWDIEERPTQVPGTGGVYFSATSEYLPAAGVPGVLRCVCRIEAGGFDTSGQHCSSAYPLHVNLAFSDNNLWGPGIAERLAASTVSFCEQTFCRITGMPDPVGKSFGRFLLQEGAWVNGPFYPD
jgi:hypothetical protein